MTKAQKLRALFKEKNIVRIVGAHDAIGARLATRHEFDGVWASGLEISTAHGVPDESILTEDQFFAAAQRINGASDLPVLCDCDTGFGGSDHIGSVVQKYENAGLAGIVIEDKQFPKKNSFSNHGHELLPVEEFAQKISTAKNAQTTAEFMVCARIESFIAGAGIDDALSRAHAYQDAGADAIVIHSKSDNPDEIYAFAEKFRRVIPLIAIPTSYYSVSADELFAHGFSLVIYANQGLRAAVAAMDTAFHAIARDRSTASIEKDIAPLSEIFNLTNGA